MPLLARVANKSSSVIHLGPKDELCKARVIMTRCHRQRTRKVLRDFGVGLEMFTTLSNLHRTLETDSLLRETRNSILNSSLSLPGTLVLETSVRW